MTLKDFEVENIGFLCGLGGLRHPRACSGVWHKYSSFFPHLNQTMECARLRRVLLVSLWEEVCDHELLQASWSSWMFARQLPDHAGAVSDDGAEVYQPRSLSRKVLRAQLRRQSRTNFLGCFAPSRRAARRVWQRDCMACYLPQAWVMGGCQML